MCKDSSKAILACICGNYRSQGGVKSAFAVLFTRSSFTYLKLCCAAGVHVNLSLSLAQARIGATTVAKLGRNFEYQETKLRNDLRAQMEEEVSELHRCDLDQEGCHLQ